MKLEIKHLTPYLPFSLNGINILEEQHSLYTLIGITVEYCVFKSVKYSKVEGNIKHFKPYLRPLSDLGKQFPKTVSGIRYVDEINKSSMYQLDKHGDFYNLPESMNAVDTWENFEGLFKYHFDIFGLIEAGLAIDINTIPHD